MTSTHFNHHHNTPLSQYTCRDNCDCHGGHSWLNPRLPKYEPLGIRWPKERTTCIWNINTTDSASANTNVSWNFNLGGNFANTNSFSWFGGNSFWGGIGDTLGSMLGLGIFALLGRAFSGSGQATPGVGPGQPGDPNAFLMAPRPRVHISQERAELTLFDVKKPEQQQQQPPAPPTEPQPPAPPAEPPAEPTKRRC